MGDILTSVLAFIVAISVLVAVHEYGHYIVGRWTGMKVLRFSIGFGKPIWSRRGGKDNTEYCVSSIPLGGYVRFLDGREDTIEPEDEGRAFNHRPIPARIAVLLAGPIFNFLFAIVAYWILFAPGVTVMKPAVGEVTPGSYADNAGLEFGDKIVAVGGSKTAGWESALVAILDTMVSERRIPLTLENTRGDQRRATLEVGDDATRLTEPGALFEGLGFEAWQPRPLIDTVTPGGSASLAGLQSGDRITSIDGKPIKYWADILTTLRDIPGKAVDLEYSRDGYVSKVALTLNEQGAGKERRGLLGISGVDSYEGYYFQRRYSPMQSLSAAIEKTWSTTVFTVHMLGRMVTGDVSYKNMSSFVGIAQFAGESAERGPSYFLGFLAIISISLGILNLLPIPVLDGGQIVYQVAEAIKGGPLTERAQILGQQIGILALLLLMSLAVFNDIERFLG